LVTFLCGGEGLPRKEGESFSEWFDYVIREAEVYDYGRYPVKGMGVWMPYGYAIRKNIIEMIRRLLDSTGHEEILLPILIPEDLISKEAEHIKGFSDQVYWVTHGGLEELDVKLALRPTSETSLTYMESFWLSSYKELPKKYYQIVSIFRYETKATRPMIRLREVTTFKEAHTAHDSFEDAERQVFEAVEIYSRIFDELGIPYIVSKRPDWDKFAGALYTIAFDTILPDGKVLQIGTVHHLGQSFSKALNAKIHLQNGENDYIWQTSYGLSDRVVASVIAIHGDDKGLILPFKIAPLKTVIVPIPSKDEQDNKKILDYSRKIAEQLSECGISAKVDDRPDYTPGWKYNYWELKGIPVRIEVGLREVNSNTITVVRRDSRERINIGIEDVCLNIKKIGEQLDADLQCKAKRKFNESLTRASTIDEAKKVLSEKRGIVEIPWCGRITCGKRMEEEVDARFLGSPLKVSVEEISKHKCPVCGSEAKTIARLAKTY
jgi:prolyl-tRNA synthetase